MTIFFMDHRLWMLKLPAPRKKRLPPDKGGKDAQVSQKTALKAEVFDSLRAF